MTRLHFWMYPFFQGSINESDYKKSKNINTYPKIVRNGIKETNERYDLREFERVIPHVFDNIHIIYFIYIILQRLLDDVFFSLFFQGSYYSNGIDSFSRFSRLIVFR